MKRVRISRVYVSVFLSAGCFVMLRTAAGSAEESNCRNVNWEEVVSAQRVGRQEFREKAAELVGRMTLEEKAGLWEHSAPEIKRLGINAYDWWNEAAHGVARNGKATQFPVGMCMGSTFDPELIYDMACAIGREGRAKYNALKPENRFGRYNGLTFFSPTINMARDPRWGRNDEIFSEDPLLMSEMAVAYVRGLQGTHPKYFTAVATAKHFAANNSENHRYNTSPPISERTLREYYLPAFRAAVEQANVQSIMTAYNGINGVPCGINKWLITDVLRGEWGFNGTVVTDAGGPSKLIAHHKTTDNCPESAALHIKAGVDVGLVFPGKSEWYTACISEAVQKGLVSEELLNSRIIQNLTTRMQIGQIVDDPDNPYKNLSEREEVGKPAHLEIARRIATEGIILLKNDPVDGRPLLPVDPKRFNRIEVIGPFANRAQLGGYSGGPTRTPSTPFSGLRDAAEGMTVVLPMDYKKCVSVPSRNLKVNDANDARNGLKAEYFGNSNLEGTPVTVKTDESIDFKKAPASSVRWTGCLAPDTAGEYVLAGGSDDGIRVWLDDKLVIDDWEKHRMRDAWSAPINLEAGRLYKIRVDYYNIGAQGGACLKWVVPQKNSEGNIDGYDPTKTLAVYVGGFDDNNTGEFSDVTNLNLPEDQRSGILQAQKKYGGVVVVLNGGNIFADQWLVENVQALFEAWYPGEEGGAALADLLMGKVSPSGRLPVTWYRSTENLPDLLDYEITHGRTYQYCPEDQILFPFGFGLSYTSFELGSLKVAKTTITSAEDMIFEIPVKNIGSYAGDEVVQVYAMERESSVQQPKRKLIGFGRISVPVGGENTLKLVVSTKRLAYWDEKEKAFVVEPGRYNIGIGVSSADIRSRCSIDIVDVGR